jgi:hypothetical protein
MTRLISIVGMSGGFLMISPKLRDCVSHILDVCSLSMNDYSPFSYIAAAVGIFSLFTMVMHRSGKT